MQGWGLKNLCKYNHVSKYVLTRDVNKIFIQRTPLKSGYRGSTVVNVLCYKSEGRWFDSRWCHWNFSLT